MAETIQEGDIVIGGESPPCAGCGCTRQVLEQRDGKRVWVSLGVDRATKKWWCNTCWRKRES